MSVLELTTRQRKLLEVVIHLHRRTGDTVKSDEIAEMIDRDPGTVRNQMPGLTALGLVESDPGPSGGYAPTAAAYGALGFEPVESIEAAQETESVPLVHDGTRVDGVTVLEIDLVSVHHPAACRAEIHLQGSIIPYHTGDRVVVGPTAGTDLVVEGTVIGKDEVNNCIILAVEGMRAPADRPD